MLSKSNKKLFFFFRILILFISFALVYWIVDFKLVIYYIKSIQWYIIVGLVLISFFRTWLTGLRWRLLNPDISGQLSQWQYFRFLMISKAFNIVMPGALGGDLVRAAITANAVHKKKATNIFAIFADRFIGLISIMLFGTIAFLFSTDIPDRSVFYHIFLILYIAFGLIILLFSNRITFSVIEKIASRLGKSGLLVMRMMETWKFALIYFRSNRKKVYIALLLCVPIHMVSLVTTYAIAIILGINISFLSLSMVFALVWLITTVPLTLSGVGVRELSLIYLLSLYNVGAEEATALSAYLYIVMLSGGLIGFLFFIDWGKLCNYMIERLGGRKN